MIYPNTPPKDYEYRVEFGLATSSRTDLKELTALGQGLVQVGVQYDPGIHGIEFGVVNKRDLSSAVDRHYAVLVTPWGSYTTPVVLTWENTYKVRIRVLQQQLSTDCDAWSYQNSGIEMYVDNVLVHTISGTLTDSGAGFDRRYCVPHFQCTSDINPAYLFNVKGCATAAYLDEILQNYTTVGWRLKIDGSWTVKDIELKLDQTIPDPVAVSGCPPPDCKDEIEHYAITVDPDDKSWGIRILSDVKHDLEYTDTTRIICPCDCSGSGGGIPWVYDYRDQFGLFYRRYTTIDAAPTDAGLPNYLKEAGASCWCCGTEEPYTIVGPTAHSSGTTIASAYQYLEVLKTYQRCFTLIDLGSCPIGCTAPTLPCEQVPTVCCAYKAYRQTTWPLHNCADSTKPDLHHFPTHDTYLAYLIDSDVWVKHKVNEHGSWATDVQVTTSGICDNPCIYTRPNNHLLLTYRKIGVGIVERWSFDDGETWSDEVVAIANGYYPEIRTNPQGDIVRLAYVASNKLKGTYQRGGDTSPSALFTCQYHNGTTLVDLEIEASPFGIDFAYNQQGMLLGAFSILGEGTISDWFSTDDARTWTRFP